MDRHKLLMHAYLGEYRVIELELDDNNNLFANVICANGEKNKYLIKNFIYRDIAVNKADDLLYKLISFTKGTTIKKSY